MSRESLERVNRLERRIKLLEQLPERMTALEAQIVQLREEMRGEFSAARTELRAEIRDVDAGLTKKMHALFSANERHMRLLHEDLVQRIAMIREGR